MRFTVAYATLPRSTNAAATNAADARNTYPWALPDLGQGDDPLTQPD